MVGLLGFPAVWTEKEKAKVLGLSHEIGMGYVLEEGRVALHDYRLVTVCLFSLRIFLML